MDTNGSTASASEGNGNVKQCEQAEEMDEAKMAKKPRPDLCRHRQGNERRRQHEQHVDLPQESMSRSTFASKELEGADDKCWQNGCQV